jgi:KDO2-lipid IV(A) lauroyltransferase
VTPRLFYIITWIGMEAGRLVARLLPLPWLLNCADALSNIGFYFCRKFRERSGSNISTALGAFVDAAAVDEIARSSLRNFARSCVEIGFALGATTDQLRAHIPVTGKEHLDAALRKGYGVMLLSAHLGNFFLLGTRLAAEGYAVSVLVNPPKDKQLAQLMDHYRLRIGQRTIRARPRMEALKELAASMRRNEVSVLIADEYRRGRGISVPLFNRTVIARRGPATVALRTGATIVPACMIRQPDGTLRLAIEPELVLDRSGKGRKQIEDNMVCITQWLERTVRAHPGQWNWMNIRWSNEPKYASRRHPPMRQAV